MDRHVILGAGPLGLAVARALSGSGRTVRLVNRSGRAAHAPPGVELHAADLLELASARRAVEGASVVYQCSQPPYHQWPERFPPLQRAIIAAVEGTGARLVVAENVYGYGEVAGPLTEGLPLTATTRKGSTRAAMTRELLEAHAAGRLSVAIGRASDFFGPLVEGSAVGERFFGALVSGKPVELLGNPDVVHSYTFIDDFGAALVTLGERAEAVGRAWHVPQAPAVTSRRFAELAIAAARSSSTVRPVPRWVVQAMGLFVPPVREMVEMLYEFEQPFVVDSTAFEQAFGTTATPLEAALATTVEWYRGAPGRAHAA